METTPEILEKLSALEIFSDFSEKNEENKRILTNVCQILTVQDFSAGETIITEGEEGDALYILFKGKVQVLRNTPGNEQFAVVNLATEQNVFFGEIALIDHDRRSASVRALTDCSTLKLAGQDFINLCEKEPLLGYRALFRIAKRIAASLRRSTKDILTLYEALLDEVDSGS